MTRFNAYPSLLLVMIMLPLMGFSGSNTSSNKGMEINDPFRIDNKPPTIGYISRSIDPVDHDLLQVQMIAQTAGVLAQIEPRSFSQLRRGLQRTQITQENLEGLEIIGYIHLSRGHSSITHEVYEVDDDALAIRSIQESNQIWKILRKSFERLGIHFAQPADKSGDKSGDRTDDRIDHKLTQKTVPIQQPYTQSPTQLDLKTVRARIKQSYPRLSRDLTNETFRIRLPINYDPQAPSGVLIWISPTQDGRIPTIFHPVLDQLGLIAIGVDNNGNKRPITDRLQNHLDSIETVASELLIDQERIYLTGMSGGGRCSGILQLAFPDLFAGAVPIVGLDTYHKAPTGRPNQFWPARLSKPAARWMNLLKNRRIAGITGSADFNEPEMTIRQGLLKRDGIEMRLDVIEGMAHTMPTADQFTSALLWVDEPRRESIETSLEEATQILKDYYDSYAKNPPSDIAGRKKLIEIMTLAPWSSPAWHAAELLGYPKPE